MHEIDNLNCLLAELGMHYAIAGLRLDAAATVGLCLKDGTELDLEYDAGRGRLHAYTPVMPIPRNEAQRLALFEAMLDFNCLQRETGSATLAVHRQREMAICQIWLTAADLQLATLDHALNDLLACRENIARRLNQSVHAAKAPGIATVARGACAATLLAARSIKRM